MADEDPSQPRPMLTPAGPPIGLPTLFTASLYQQALYHDEDGNPKYDHGTTLLIDARDAFAEFLLSDVLGKAQANSLVLAGITFNEKGFGVYARMINEVDFIPEAHDYAFDKQQDIAKSLFTEENKTICLEGGREEVNHVLTRITTSLLMRFQYVVWVVHDGRETSGRAFRYGQSVFPKHPRFITLDVQEAFHKMTMTKMSMTKANISLASAMERLWATLNNRPNQFFFDFVATETHGSSHNHEGALPRPGSRYIHNGGTAIVGVVPAIDETATPPVIPQPSKLQIAKRKAQDLTLQSAKRRKTSDAAEAQAAMDSAERQLEELVAALDQAEKDAMDQVPMKRGPTEQASTKQAATWRGGAQTELSAEIMARITILQSSLTWLAGPGNVKPVDQMGVETIVTQYRPSAAMPRKKQTKLDMFGRSVRRPLSDVRHTTRWLTNRKNVWKVQDLVRNRVDGLFRDYEDSIKSGRGQRQLSNSPGMYNLISDKPGRDVSITQGKQGSIDMPGADERPSDEGEKEEKPDAIGGSWWGSLRRRMSCWLR